MTFPTTGWRLGLCMGCAVKPAIMWVVCDGTQGEVCGDECFALMYPRRENYTEFSDFMDSGAPAMHGFVCRSRDELEAAHSIIAESNRRAYQT